MRLLNRKRQQAMKRGLVKIASNSIRISELDLPKTSKKLDLSMFDLSNSVEFETKGNTLATLKASVLSVFSSQ